MLERRSADLTELLSAVKRGRKGLCLTDLTEFPSAVSLPQANSRENEVQEGAGVFIWEEAGTVGLSDAAVSSRSAFRRKAVYVRIIHPK